MGDQQNMLFMGTVIPFGRGSAIITETGMRTELGKIAEMIQSVEDEMTPLQKKLDQFGKLLALIALGIVVLVFIEGCYPVRTSEFCCAHPSAWLSLWFQKVLPAVVTIALALGAQRMLKRQALIRKLPAVETLGSVTVICSDKTGTLTENKMTVTILDVAENRLDFVENLKDFSPSITSSDAAHPIILGNDAAAILLSCGALCNDAFLEPSEDDPESFTTVGDPTEGALVIAAAKVGLIKNALEDSFPRVAELPFDSDRKRMTTLHQITDNLPQLLQPTWEKLSQHVWDLKYLAITKGCRGWFAGNLQPGMDKRSHPGNERGMAETNSHVQRDDGKRWDARARVGISFKGYMQISIPKTIHWNLTWFLWVCLA